MVKNGTLCEIRVQNNFQNRICFSEQVARVSTQWLMALARRIEKSFELSENYSIKKMHNFTNSEGPLSSISNFSRKIRHGSPYRLWIGPISVIYQGRLDSIGTFYLRRWSLLNIAYYLHPHYVKSTWPHVCYFYEASERKNVFLIFVFVFPTSFPIDIGRCRLQVKESSFVTLSLVTNDQYVPQFSPAAPLRYLYPTCGAIERLYTAYGAIKRPDTACDT